MALRTLLMLASASIVFLLGSVHLLYTFVGTRLHPRSAAVVDAMKGVTLVITPETTLWKAYLGFNVTHSMTGMLFGLVYGYLAIAHPDVLFNSWFLRGLGVLALVSLVLLARAYFFSVPLAGVSVALVCFIVSIAWRG